MHKDKFLSLAYVWIGGLLPLLKPEKKDLTGKTVVVTGGNSGVGYGLALQLAEMGASVYIACRSEVRAAKARNSMLESCPDAKIGIEILVRPMSYLILRSPRADFRARTRHPSSQ